MANDVKNVAAGNTGNAENGRTVILTGRSGATRVQTLDSPRLVEFEIADFEVGDGPDLDDRFDDIRYYSGDTET